MERIKTTPMTFGYVATLRFFLIFWLCTLPITLVGMYHWVAPPVLSMIAFLFFNVEQVGAPPAPDAPEMHRRCKRDASEMRWRCAAAGAAPLGQ